MGSTFGEALSAAADALRAAGIEEARFDAEVLLEHATGWDRARMAANPGDEVPGPAARRFGEMLRRRLRREPVAYIVGGKWFRNIELMVDPRVLIPRPETESLVELALQLDPKSVLDVGTGCGAVALAIADEMPECQVTATDTSAAALEVARANAERLGLAERVRFLEGTVPPIGGATGPDEAPAGHAGRSADRGAAPKHDGGAAEHAESSAEHAERPAEHDDGFDLLVANLPYVAEPDWDSLAPEVTEWEPREALLAGPDGLDAIRDLLADNRIRGLSRYPGQSANSVTEVVALEVGEGQAEAVSAMLDEAGFHTIDTRRDLAGIERVVWGRR